MRGVNETNAGWRGSNLGNEPSTHRSVVTRSDAWRVSCGDAWLQLS